MYELHNKKLMLLQGVKLCLDFCEHNEIPQPNFLTRKYTKQRGKKARRHGTYFPEERAICVYPENCRAASNSPYAWSWPGYTADLTPVGVATHELGHHWHICSHESRDSRGKSSWAPLMHAYRREVMPCEKAVTSYGETNCAEGIAEAFKIFVTNPTLLLALAPFHYAFFLRRGLKPIITVHWRDVLAGSQRHLDNVKRKISNGRIA